MKLFVYGTLKLGYCNHRVLGDAVFLGNFTTDSVYSMYDLGSYPSVSLEGTTAIVGEVYEISDLTSVDMLEGYPTFYNRSEIETDFGLAWIYHYLPMHGDIIANGFWK